MHSSFLSALYNNCVGSLLCSFPHNVISYLWHTALKTDLFKILIIGFFLIAVNHTQSFELMPLSFTPIIHYPLTHSSNTKFFTCLFCLFTFPLVRLDVTMYQLSKRFGAIQKRSSYLILYLQSWPIYCHSIKYQCWLFSYDLSSGSL